MKVITFYLPQFHTFPENDAWWGKGFTEWTNTKKAKALFKGHYQPNIPYQENYYDLAAVEPMRQQAETAKKFGVYGFCFYHYWFKDCKKLMEGPVERFRDDKSIDFHYCLSWANEPWTRAWDGGEKQVIMPQEYGNKDEWIKHFEYLLSFFRDSRYIKIDGKPVLLLYRPDLITDLDQMLDCWEQLAQANGFSGLCLMAQGSAFCGNLSHDGSRFDYCIEFEPGFTRELFRKNNVLKHPIAAVHNPGCAAMFLWSDFKAKLESGLGIKFKKPVRLFSYDTVCRAISKRPLYRNNMLPGLFPSWDNTPRRGRNGQIYAGSTPEKFKQYLKERLHDAKEKYHSDMIFINAWNEWAESAYLEPDERNGYAYLQALKEALQENEGCENKTLL